jgi:hypothetical protein
MNINELKDKLEKGKQLGADVVYIKEDSVLSGIGSVYKDQEQRSITILKSDDDTIKVNDFINLLDKISYDIGNGQVYTGSGQYSKDGLKEIISLEFAKYETQYESTKVIFINI